MPSITKSELSRCISGVQSITLVFTICMSGCSGKQLPSLPNVVLITTDDLGLQLNCYGDSTVPTPNIDALADAGIRYTNAYVTQASCSPSRSSIFTGLYPHENGQLGLAHRGEFAMVPGLMTLPKMFREQGYKTGVIGKVHVRPAKDFPFDYNTNEGFPANETKDVIRVRDSVVSFLDRYKRQPFFLMVNYFDPHRPYNNLRVNGLPEDPLSAGAAEPFSFLGMASDRIMEDIAGYYNCVKRLDAGIGMLMRELEARGLTRNTLIVFLGDHGPPFPRAKVSCYEAGLKIPFILVWPGNFTAGTVRDDFVSTVDIFPTLAQASGWKGLVPGEGHSLLKRDTEIKPGTDTEDDPGSGAGSGRKYLFAEYNAHQSSSFHPQRTVRFENYKLILTLLEGRTFVGDNQPPPRLADYLDQSPDSPEMKAVFDNYIIPPRCQLYDISKDPDERHNLAEDPGYDSIKAILKAELQQWRERTKDPFLDPEILSAMTREQDSLKQAGVRRVHENAYKYLKERE